jgi:hypothetical protein
MSETTEEGTSPVRTFWPTDYKRFAGVIRHVRLSEGDEKAEDVRTAIMGFLAADSDQFDEAKFAAATGPAMPAYVAQLAKTVKQARHVRCQPYTGKDTVHQEKLDAVAGVLTGILGEVPGFDADTFVTSTKLAQTPTYGYTDNDDEDPDY